MHAIGLLLRVAAVFALLGGTLWVLRRGMPGQRRTSMVQVVESVRLGKSASASLLKVGDTTYLVGVTDHGVALLAEPKLAETTEPAQAADAVQLDLLGDAVTPEPLAVATAAPAGPPTMRVFLTTVATRLVAQLRALRSRLDADAAAEAARKSRATPRTAGPRKPTLAAFTAAFGQQLRQLRPRPQLAAAGAGGPGLVLDASPGPSFDALLADELEALDRPADEPPARTAVLSVVPDAEDEYDELDGVDDEFDEYDDDEYDAVAAAPEAESLAQLARQLQMLDSLPKTPPVQTVADGPAPVVVPATRPTAARTARSTRTDAPRFIDEEHPWSLPCRRARQHTGPRATSLV